MATMRNEGIRAAKRRAVETRLSGLEFMVGYLSSAL